MNDLSVLDIVVLVLVIVGGINWGLIGIGGWNVVNLLFGSWVWLERTIYVFVGLSAVWSIKFFTD